MHAQVECLDLFVADHRAQHAALEQVVGKGMDVLQRRHGLVLTLGELEYHLGLRHARSHKVAQFALGHLAIELLTIAQSAQFGRQFGRGCLIELRQEVRQPDILGVGCGMGSCVGLYGTYLFSRMVFLLGFLDDHDTFFFLLLFVLRIGLDTLQRVEQSQLMTHIVGDEIARQRIVQTLRLDEVDHLREGHRDSRVAMAMHVVERLHQSRREHVER